MTRKLSPSLDYMHVFFTLREQSLPTGRTPQLFDVLHLFANAFEGVLAFNNGPGDFDLG
jgi:hypothetical protein